MHTIFPPGVDDDDDDGNVADDDDKGDDDDVYDDQSNVDDNVPGIFPPSLAPHCLTIMPIKSTDPMMMMMMMKTIEIS